MRKWFSDVWQFICAVFNHWIPLATGGFVMAALWFLQAGMGVLIPQSVNFWLAIVFLACAAFGAWREKRDLATKAETEAVKLQAKLDEKPLRPIEKRDLLNALIEEGNELLDQFKNSQKLPLESEILNWIASTNDKVKRYFEMEQYDRLNDHNVSAGAAFELALALPKEGEEKNPHYDLALNLKAKLEGLETLRKTLRTQP